MMIEKDDDGCSSARAIGPAVNSENTLGM
jgi:hypothetical protein